MVRFVKKVFMQYCAGHNSSQNFNPFYSAKTVYIFCASQCLGVSSPTSSTFFLERSQRSQENGYAENNVVASIDKAGLILRYHWSMQ